MMSQLSAPPALSPAPVATLVDAVRASPTTSALSLLHEALANHAPCDVEELTAALGIDPDEPTDEACSRPLGSNLLSEFPVLEVPSIAAIRRACSHDENTVRTARIAALCLSTPCSSVTRLEGISWLLALAADCAPHVARRHADGQPEPQGRAD